MNEERVVRGLLRENELASNPEASVEEVMRNGPARFRPNEPVEKMLRMWARGASAVLVTTSDGRLVGLLYRKDAEHPAGVRP